MYQTKRLSTSVHFQNGTVIDVLHIKKCVLSLLSVKIVLDTWHIDQHYGMKNLKWTTNQSLLGFQIIYHVNMLFPFIK